MKNSAPYLPLFLNVLTRSPILQLTTGSAIRFVCDENYRQAVNDSICMADGKWSPTVQCYPGLYTYVILDLENLKLNSFESLFFVVKLLNISLKF